MLLRDRMLELKLKTKGGSEIYESTQLVYLYSSTSPTPTLRKSDYFRRSSLNKI
jgi:hypothetical protein